MPICPLSNISGVSWVYDLSETATVYHSSTTDFSPSEICVHHDTNSSYLFFLKPFVTNSGKGKLSFQIRKDFGNSMLNVSFGKSHRVVCLKFDFPFALLTLNWLWPAEN